MMITSGALRVPKGELFTDKLDNWGKFMLIIMPLTIFEYVSNWETTDDTEDQ